MKVRIINICQKQTMFFLNWYFWQLDAKVYIHKIQYFSLMLAKNLSNFVSLPLKLDNPSYHNIQTRHQAKWQAYDKLRQMKYSTPFWLLHSQHTHKQHFLFTYHFYLDFGFYSTKGQKISKCLFFVFNFFQKNEGKHVA